MIIKHCLYLLACIAFSLWSIKDFDGPYVWVALAWMILLVHAAITLKKPVVRRVCFNLACAALIFGCVEGWMQCKKPPDNRHHVDTIEDYVDPHETLGYAPRPSVQTFARKFYGDKLGYDVTYTFNEHGHRLSNPDERAGDAALFFGCSFTFGEGVDDHQAMPYRAGELAGHRYRMHNLAFSGYGPHQMLAAIENGLVDQLNVQPKVAIYQGLLHHVNRSAGLAVWDRRGPQYKLTGDGQVRYAGPFTRETQGSRIIDEIKYQLRKSLLVRRVLDRPTAVRPEHVELYLAIIDRARTLIEKRFPDCKFHVLLWDSRENPLHDTVLQGLRDRGLRVHLVSDIDPELLGNRFKISPHDPHPNPQAHDLIARYLAKLIHPQNPRLTAR